MTAEPVDHVVEDICKQDLDLTRLSSCELVRLHAKFERAAERGVYEVRAREASLRSQRSSLTLVGDLAVLGMDVADEIIARLTAAERRQAAA